MKPITTRALLLLPVLAMVFGLSCTNIDGLSDTNTITGFEITSHTPAEIELGEIEITDSEIIIPILYNGQKMPLNFTADLTFDGEIDRIAGADFSQIQTLENPGDQLEFIVLAPSGMPHKYTIKTRIQNYEIPEDIDFFVKSVSPEYVPVLGKGRIVDDTMWIYAIEPEFPLTILPLFDVASRNLDFENFINGKTELVFETASSVNHFVMIDRANGSKRDITVKLAASEPVSGSDHESTNIFSTDFAVTFGKDRDDSEIKGFRIDNDSDSIAVFIRPLTPVKKTSSGDELFPVTLTISLGDLGSDVGFIDYAPTKSFTFYEYDQPQYFYIIDLATGQARRWRVALCEYVAPIGAGEADVVKFAYDYHTTKATYTKESAILDVSVVQILPEQGEIWLKMTEITKPSSNNYTWSVTLKDIVMEVSDGATFEVPEISWVDYETWESAKTFEVFSPAGKKKVWSVRLKDWRNYTQSSEAEITDIKVLDVQPMNVLLDPKVPTYVDSAQRTITINIMDDDAIKDYPLTAMLSYELSEFATVTSAAGNANSVEFATRESEVPITVKAEDGTEQIWTLKLASLSKVGKPAVNSFRINSFPSAAFILRNVEIDDANSRIVISLNQAGSFGATINYTMGLSRNTESTIPIMGSMSFKNLNATNKFTITRGAESREWTVAFAEHLPQLDNWELDSWIDDNTPSPNGIEGRPYWTSANNSFVKGTTRTTGLSGSAARLATGSALAKLTSGSLFLGWFDTSNIIAGLSDPVKLTFQGIEFAASRKLTGFEADIKYNGLNEDTGSLAIELIRHTDKTKPYVYHGTRPSGELHPDNTAVKVARGRKLVGNTAATQNGETVSVVPSGQWTKIRVELDYGSLSDPLDFTHLLIICASSSQGDSFIGTQGTELILDNIKLIYE